MIESVCFWIFNHVSDFHVPLKNKKINLTLLSKSYSVTFTVESEIRRAGAGVVEISSGFSTGGFSSSFGVKAS